MKYTFKRGVHPSACKLTNDFPLAEMPTPDIVCIPLSQHIGAPSQPVVNVGDSVKAGTMVGKAGGFVSANIFSSVSGTVKGFKMLPTPAGGACNHVVIENDGKYETEHLSVLDNPSKEEIIARITEAGIVGMGGATFPTHVKLMPKNKVDYLIINAAECEPYITCDYRLMMEETEDFLLGVKFLKKALGVEKAYIGVELNKPAAIEKLSKAATDGIEVIPLKVKYPQGAEKQLIYAITRRRVPCGGLPADIGVVVDNVHTAYSTCRAIKYGEPLYRRAMTVSGGGINNKGNFWVRNGVSYDFIHKYTQGGEPYVPYVKVISGGPMMGFAQPTLNAVTAKGGSSLLFLTAEEVNVLEQTPCINCAGCAKVCPMHLMPMKIEAAVLADNPQAAKDAGILNCIECGSCAYNCPAKRPLTQAIRLGKRMIRERGIK